MGSKCDFNDVQAFGSFPVKHFIKTIRNLDETTGQYTFIELNNNVNLIFYLQRVQILKGDLALVPKNICSIINGV